MQDNQLIKYDNALVKRVGNSVTLANKLLNEIKVNKTICPRCLGKRFVNKDDIKRLNRLRRLNRLTYWSTGFCLYCQGDGEVELNLIKHISPADLFYGSFNETQLEYIDSLKKEGWDDDDIFDEVLINLEWWGDIMTTCPRCLGKRVVDYEDLKRLKRDNASWWTPHLCFYCQGLGDVLAKMLNKIDPADLFYGISFTKIELGHIDLAKKEKYNDEQIIHIIKTMFLNRDNGFDGLRSNLSGPLNDCIK